MTKNAIRMEAMNLCENIGKRAAKNVCPFLFHEVEVPQELAKLHNNSLQEDDETEV